MLAYMHWHPPNKVWILDCKSCATFITNRGMKAVLLLRPNVSLFSSDAFPLNCSPYTANTDPFCSRSLSHSRSCECLTQSLCCHVCGSTIGYMIILPCTRCTSSITATNRTTNGHRFVFHSTEVVGTERRYIPDEPGIIPYNPFGVPITSHLDNPQDHSPSRSPSPAHSHISDYLPTPPLEYANPTIVSSTSFDAFPFPHGYNYSSPENHPSSYAPGPYPPYFVPHPHSHSQPVSIHSHYPTHLINRPIPTAFSRSTPPPLIHTSFPLSVPLEQKDLPPHKLQAGDTLYWHHLAKFGEIPGVEEDQRARGDIKPTAAGGKLAATLNFDR